METKKKMEYFISREIDGKVIDKKAISKYVYMNLYRYQRAITEKGFKAIIEESKDRKKSDLLIFDEGGVSK